MAKFRRIGNFLKLLATFLGAKIAIENGDFFGEIFGIIQLNFRLKIAFFSHLIYALARYLEEGKAAAVLREREGKRESAAPRRSEREREVRNSHGLSGECGTPRPQSLM